MSDQITTDSELFVKSIEKENYIPVSRFALMAALSNHEAAQRHVTNVSAFFPILEIWRHQQYREKMSTLKESYLQFSPDRDTVSYLQHTESELDAKLDTLVAVTTEMLEQANYSRIANEDLNRILSESSSHGLSLTVDLEEFDEVMLYYRGADTQMISSRSYKSLWLRLDRREEKFYRRLFLLFKLKPEDERLPELMTKNHWSEKKARRVLKKNRATMPKGDNGQFVYMKLFKNIPEDDLEMMFPNTQVRFKLFDKIKLGVTAGGGTLASIGAAIGKLALATTNPVAFLGGVLSIGAVIFRHVKTFFMTRDKYQLQLAERLYFHALADNRGALVLLGDRGEEEDIKEDMLLYYFLFYNPIAQENVAQLDKMIEDYLLAEFKVDCDFDMNDALRRLAKDQLVYLDAHNIVTALPPEQAHQLLDQKWDLKLKSVTEITV